MELNLKKFNELFHNSFHDNYAEAGRQLLVSPAQLFRIRNHQGKPGVVFFGRLRAYCQKHKLNFEDYFFYN